MTYGYPKKWKENMTSGQVIAAELRLGIVSGEIESHIQLSENQVANNLMLVVHQSEMHLSYFKQIN